MPCTMQNFCKFPCQHARTCLALKKKENNQRPVEVAFLLLPPLHEIDSHTKCIYEDEEYKARYVGLARYMFQWHAFSTKRSEAVTVLDDSGDQIPILRNTHSPALDLCDSEDGILFRSHLLISFFRFPIFALNLPHRLSWMPCPAWAALICCVLISHSFGVIAQHAFRTNSNSQASRAPLHASPQVRVATVLVCTIDIDVILLLDLQSSMLHAGGDALMPDDWCTNAVPLVDLHASPCSHSFSRTSYNPITHPFCCINALTAWQYQCTIIMKIIMIMSCRSQAYPATVT
jgi:hypothetical protein